MYPPGWEILYTFLYALPSNHGYHDNRCHLNGIQKKTYQFFYLLSRIGLCFFFASTVQGQTDEIDFTTLTANSGDNDTFFVKVTSATIIVIVI